MSQVTESITNKKTSLSETEETKRLLLRLTIEARYRSPNGGYVSTHNKSNSQSAKTSEIAYNVAANPQGQLCTNL